MATLPITQPRPTNRVEDALASLDDWQPPDLRAIAAEFVERLPADIRGRLPAQRRASRRRRIVRTAIAVTAGVIVLAVVSWIISGQVARRRGSATPSLVPPAPAENDDTVPDLMDDAAASGVPVFDEATSLVSSSRPS